MAKRKYHYNEDFFKTWTKESAQVFGLFIADGNIYSKPGKGPLGTSCEWKLALHEKDAVYLGKVASAMGYDGELGVDKNTRRLRIYSKEIYQDMLDLGVTPRKSLTLVCPEVPDEVFSYFLRGVVEGDGYVKVKSPGKGGVSPYPRVEITSGSRVFLEGLRDKVTELVGVNGGIYEYRNKGSENSAYKLIYSCKKANSFLDYIYTDPTLVMDRKYEEYLYWCELREALKRRKVDG